VREFNPNALPPSEVGEAPPRELSKEEWKRWRVVFGTALGAAVALAFVFLDFVLKWPQWFAVDFLVSLGTVITFLWTWLWPEYPIRVLMLSYLNDSPWEEPERGEHPALSGWEGSRTLSLLTGSFTVIGLATVAFLADSPAIVAGGGIPTNHPAFVGVCAILGSAVLSAWAFAMFSSAASPQKGPVTKGITASYRAKAFGFAFYCLMVSVFAFFIGLLWAISELNLLIPVVSFLIFFLVWAMNFAFVRVSTSPATA
jgi:hypothetical protein